MEQPSTDYINKLSNGDEVFSKKMIQLIKREFSQEKKLYYKTIQRKRYKAAAQHVHKLKHKISILSFENGYIVASQHENRLNDNINDFEQEFDEVLNTIINYLEVI